MPQLDAFPRIEDPSLNEYLEAMSKVVFQSGISWRVVLSKWDGISEGFNGFDIDVVASMTDDDLGELAQDPKMIRSRRKMAAVVHNARRILELDAEFGTFRAYLRSHGQFEDVLKDIRKQFKYVGEVGGHHFLYVVGEEIPTPKE